MILLWSGSMGSISAEAKIRGPRIELDLGWTKPSSMLRCDMREVVMVRLTSLEMRLWASSSILDLTSGKSANT